MIQTLGDQNNKISPKDLKIYIINHTKETKIRILHSLRIQNKYGKPLPTISFHLQLQNEILKATFLKPKFPSGRYP